MTTFTKIGVVFGLLLAGGCGDDWSSSCDSVDTLDAQDACVADVAEEARVQVDVREREELDRVRDEPTRRDIEVRSGACRLELDRLEDATRERIALLSRPDRPREIRRGLRDIGGEVDRCDRDLRDLGDRGDDVVRDPSDDGDTRDGDDGGDRSDETRDPSRTP